ncbi:NTPase [Virgisporangium aurantiacum]|uniref:NTPase n=1 Tax=Virgisporangium aurantiacum TaxID=175570 RepID=A0A8J3YY00_9ACTN|nr:NTPase [Virgisporangium aurantiacum]
MQAGTIHGGIHIHRTGDPPVLPRQLIATSHTFTGRDDELAELDALHSRGNRLVVLSGPGGVGKTTLAVRWAHGSAERFREGQIYVELGGQRPVSPDEALGTMLRALGVQPANVPGSRVERSSMLRSLTAGRSLLVVLDNADSPAQIGDLLPAGDAMVVITSRHRMADLVANGAVLVNLGPFSSEEGMRLLSRAVGSRVAQEPEQARKLASLCGGLPIALCVAASRLANRPHLTLGRLVAELADETGRLARLSVPDGYSVPAVFDTSYRSLPRSAAVLYRRLALHPGHDFGPGAVDVVLSLAPSDGRPGVDDLDRLLAANLLEEIDEERFRFHDLIRLHAHGRAEAEETSADRSGVTRAFIEWYLAAARKADEAITPYRRRPGFDWKSEPANVPVPGGRGDALGWFERELGNLTAAAQTAMRHGWPDLTWQLCDALWPLFLNRKHYPVRFEVDGLGVAAAREWGDVWAEAVMTKRLGRASWTLGDRAAAERHTRAAIGLYTRAKDPDGVDDAWEGFAVMLRDSGREAEAERILTEVLARKRARADPRRIALTLINLGTLRSRTGDPIGAVTLLREAELILARLVSVDPYNLARATIARAAAHLAGNDLAEAALAATRGAELAAANGSQFERAEALALLGSVAEHRSEPARAERYYRVAVEIFEGLGSGRADDLRAGLGRIDTDAAVPNHLEECDGEDPRRVG